MEHLYTSIVCTHCGKLIRVPVYCKNRFCDTCGPARSYRVREKIKHLIKCADFSDGYFLGMVTLSLPNCLDLGEGIRKLQKSFSRFRRSALWKSRIRGGVYVVEITGKPGSWHPHIHALVEQKFLSWRSFHSAWHALTGASAFHIKRIPSGAAERYVTKYLTKPPGSDEDVAQVAAELRHVRLFQPFGSWHGKIGSWVKARYPCPECGECTWYPWDQFIRDHESGKNRDPAASSVEVKGECTVEPPRPVLRQTVMSPLWANSLSSRGAFGRSLWDPKGRY